MKEYTYSVARVRSKEKQLLSEADIEQLISLSSYDEVLRMLRDKGYASDAKAVSPIVASEAELQDFLRETVGDDILKVLNLHIDYHNVKAAVKSVFSKTDASELLLDNGFFDKNKIYDSIKKREYSSMPSDLAKTSEEAHALLLRTGDGQLCDMLIDKAMLENSLEEAKLTKEEFLISFCKLNIDVSNLKIALRCALTGKDSAFTINSLVDGGSLDVVTLANAVEKGIEGFYEYIEQGLYADSVQAMKKSVAAFEKWCDDKLMDLMYNAKYDSFSVAPLIAYFYAKRTEHQAITLILSAKRNGLSEEMIRERVRRLYV